MDRTTIETYRAEEKELSHILCEKIKGLMLLQSPLDELRKYITDDMFLKTNHQAFFHVMAFLCRLHDPIEFRKRFFWPLTDKRSEANFRTSTIDYLKYLNEKHQLNWLNIKQYLVVMPGGMKFITFLLDFVKFIISEQIKQREKHFTTTELHEMTQESIVDVVSEADIQSVLRKNVYLKESSSEYLNTLHDVNNTFEEKIFVLTQQLHEISNQTNLNVDLLMGDTFLEKFWSSIQKLYKEKFLIKPLSVQNMEKPIQEFHLLINEFHKKEINLTSHNYVNKNEFLNNLKQHDIQKNYPQIKGLLDEYEVKWRNDVHRNKFVDIQDDDVDINFLMRLFNCIHKPLTMELSKINEKTPPSPVVVNKMNDLLESLQQMKEQLNNFQKMIYNKRNHDANVTVKPKQIKAEFDAKDPVYTSMECHGKYYRRWRRMLVSTPPIILTDPQKIDMAKYEDIPLFDMIVNSIVSSGSNNNRNSNNDIESKMNWLTSKSHGYSQIKCTIPEVKITQSPKHQSDESDDESDLNATVVDTPFFFSSLKKAHDKTVQHRQHYDPYEDDDDGDGNHNCTIKTLVKKTPITQIKSKSPIKLNQLQNYRHQQQQWQRQHSLLSPYTPNSYTTPKRSPYRSHQLQEQRLNSSNTGNVVPARKLFAMETDMQSNDVAMNLNVNSSDQLKSSFDAELLKCAGHNANIIITTTTITTTTTPSPPTIRLNDLTIKDNDNDNNDVDVDLDHNNYHQHHFNKKTSNSSHEQQFSTDHHNLHDTTDDTDKSTDIFNTSDTVLMVVTP